MVVCRIVQLPISEGTQNGVRRNLNVVSYVKNIFLLFSLDYISCWGHLKINFSFLYRYKFLLTNSKHSWDYLHYHFSADEFYILPILIVASGLHLFLLFTTTWFAIALKTRQLFHVTYKLFLITVLLHVSLIQKKILSDKHFSLKNCSICVGA